jgi:hypothetical protein
VTICLVVVLMLATWFAVLHALQNDRAGTAPEQVQPAATPARPSVDEILKKQRPNNAPLRPLAGLVFRGLKMAKITVARIVA